MLKKAKLYSLLALIVASTVVGLVGFSPAVSAQEGEDYQGYFSDSIYNSFVDQTYVYAFELCLRKIYGSGVVPPSVDEEWLQTDAWINGNGSVSGPADIHVGFTAEPDIGKQDGKIGCEEDSVEASTLVANYKRIIKYPGAPAGTSDYNKNIHFVCYLGFRPVDESAVPIDMSIDECVAKSSEDNVLYGLLPGKVPPVVPHVFEDEEQYLAARHTFITQCGEYKGPASGPESGQDGIEIVPIVFKNDDGSYSKRDMNFYVAEPDKDVSVMLSDDNGGRGRNYDCSELPGLMVNNAQAYIDNIPAGDTDLDEDLSGNTGANPSSCQITAIGWLVCPLVTFIASITDGAYYVLDHSLLRLPAVNMDINDESNGTYTAWKIMRDFANVIFVIVFLFIVFSQLTSIGISNYGIKRLLPKIIISAILVNLSYFICALAVDLSNLIGSSLKLFLDNIAGEILTKSTDTGFNSGLENYWGETAQKVLGATLVIGSAAVASSIGFAVFIPIVFMILPVIVTVMVAMIIRQALVIIFIFIAPLAFVAMLLPNTEGYYQKWQSLFKSMLLLYPIVALVFGGSALASAVLMTAAKDAGTGMEIVQGVAAGAIRILPLLAIPSLMKLANGVLGRFAGIANDPGKGWFDNKKNASVENSKIRKAKRVGEIGKWVNNPGGNKFQRRARRMLGGATAYGSTVREKERKDGLSKAESVLDTAYLNSERGQTARSAAENAKIATQNAQIKADTIRLESTEGVSLQMESTNLETRKQTAATDAQATAIDALASSVAGQQTLKESKEAELKKQVAETKTTAYQAGQTIEDPSLQALVRRQQQNQTATSVAQGVTARRFNKDMADGTVDVASPLGAASTGTAAGEVKKAVDAAKNEAGEKEVRKEQQSLQDDIAQHIAGGGDPDDFMEKRSKMPLDDYERKSLYNEISARGRDGIIARLKADPSHATGTPERTMLEEAVQSNVNALLPKAPHLIKGEQSAFKNVTAGQLAGFSPDTVKAFMSYLDKKLSDSVDMTLSAADRTAAADYSNLAAQALFNAVDGISKSETDRNRFDGNAGLAFQSEVMARPRLSSNPYIGSAVSAIGPSGKIS